MKRSWVHDQLRVWLLACCVSLVAALAGCESLERKFTRKPKHPLPPPNPIINFQDYNRTFTPLDRYRKHYLMFQYWNDALIDGLQSSPLNPKRFKRASTESLAELETLKGLVTEEVAARMAPVIEGRSTIDRQLQSGDIGEMQVHAVTRDLEAQTRTIHRNFFWRDIEDQLKPQMSP